MFLEAKTKRAGQVYSVLSTRLRPTLLGKKLPRLHARRGQVYFLAMMVIAGLVLIGFFLSGFVVARLQVVSNVGASTQAFMSADSATEAMLYYFIKDGPRPRAEDGTECVYQKGDTITTKCLLGNSGNGSLYWIVESCKITDSSCLLENRYFFDAFGEHQGIVRVLETKPFEIQ